MPVFKVDGPMGRAMQKMATSSWFRTIGPKVVPPTDRFLAKVSGGRIIMSQAMVPSLVLTTTGRKSGLPRESPLACVPQDGGGWWIVGSNFGKETHPAWTGNLIAEPRAKVSYEGKAYHVLARLLPDEEKAEIWDTLIGAWPAYQMYVQSSGRNLRVFDLQPA